MKSNVMVVKISTHSYIFKNEENKLILLLSTKSNEMYEEYT